ncbi:MAG TPA: serine/threonine-protein kinase [Balneolaceae bacterium]|nr:serine/threonine-protein kinase [Balneolaceae bacterium]
MKSSQWESIEKILDETLEMATKEQKAFIKHATKGNLVLEKEVTALLEAIHSSEKEHFLESNTTKNSEFIRDITIKHITDHFIGKKIGSFQIKEQIGYGGMSLVFKAERADEQFKQTVAIKLMRKGWYSKQTLRRFEQEKQILASLDHPHIARLFDGGITEDGSPYLIMEYVDGEPIDSYCDSNRLTINQRLNLFEKVCKAVEYAHHKLIIHRDLKAQNIFVTKDGTVKILDFGIAKLLKSEISEDDTTLTQPGQKLWTPQYASPEQIEGNTVATGLDVYSLGVLLHKLLTGRFPYDIKDKTSAQVSYIITTKKPETLRESLNQADSLKKITENRGTTPYRLFKKLEKDLEAITLKALEKKVSERYRSVAELADDLENYRSDRPIEARRGNKLHIIKKFVKRHKKALTIFVLFITAILTLSIYYTQQINKQKKQAIYAAEKATTVSDLLKNTLRKASPYGRNSEDISFETILSKGSDEIQTSLESKPLLKAEMMGFIAELYINLGQYEKAKSLLNNSLKIQNKAEPESYKQEVLNLSRLAYLLFRQGKVDSSISIYQNAKAILLKTNPPDDELTISLYNHMAMAYGEKSKPEKGLSLIEKALQIVPKDNLSLKAKLIDNQAMLYQNMGYYSKAIKLFNENIILLQQISKSQTPELASAYNNLAFTYQRQGNIQMADSLHNIALKIRRELLPPNHPHIASSLIRYGLVKVRQGKLKEAEKMLIEGKQILEKILPQNHWQITSAEGGLALVHGLMGNIEENILILKKIYDDWQKQFSKTDWRTKIAQKSLETLLSVKEKGADNNAL